VLVEDSRLVLFEDVNRSSCRFIYILGVAPWVTSSSSLFESSRFNHAFN